MLKSGHRKLNKSIYQKMEITYENNKIFLNHLLIMRSLLDFQKYQNIPKSFIFQKLQKEVT